MVGCKLGIFERRQGENYEDDQRYNFLDDFKLHQRKRSAHFGRSYAVGGHLEAVFEESQSPAEQNDGPERCA